MILCLWSLIINSWAFLNLTSITGQVASFSYLHKINTTITLTVMFGLWRPWASLGEQRKWWLVGPCWTWLGSSRWKVSRQVRRVQRPHPASSVATDCLKMVTALPPGTKIRSDFSVHTGSRSAQEYTVTSLTETTGLLPLMYQNNIHQRDNNRNNSTEIKY